MGEYKFSVEVSDKEDTYLMEAHFSATSFPGSTDGFDLTRDAIVQFLQQYRVVYGFQESTIAKILDQGYAQKELIAKGTPPVQGASSYFEKLLSEDEFDYELFASPSILEVDIYEFPDYTIPTVKANTPLLRKIAALPGQPGKNVLGQTLPGIKGQDKPFPKARNATVSAEDKNIMVATIEGYPIMTDDYVSVEPVCVVDKDVAQSMDFDGIVLIRGSIKDQLRVVATSDVVILGATEAVVVESGRNVVISGGVKGKEMAVMKARGDIVTRFSEMCTLEAGENVYAKNITQTFAVALGSIHAERIVGGEVRGSGLVEASILGADGVDTGVTAGKNPYLEDKISQVRESIAEKKTLVKNAMADIAKMIFTDKRRHDDPELLQLRALLPNIEFEVQRLYAQDARLHQFMQESQNASVVVYDTVYPGTIIMFGDFEHMPEEPESNIAYRAGRYGVIRQSLEGEPLDEEEGEDVAEADEEG